MGLALRMFIYFVLPAAAVVGLGTWDADTGNLTLVVNADRLSDYLMVTGGGYAATFLAGRAAKRKGGLT